MITVLVAGAAGNVGSQVVRELGERGATVRAFVRDAQRAAQRLGGDVELAVGDFEDPTALRRAMQGVDRVFVTTSNGPRHVAQENAIIDAAAAAWVQRIVKLSSIGARVGSPLSFADAHGRIERHLFGCPVPSVVLNATFLMSNLFASAETIRASGQILAPGGEAKIAMIDPRDVAASAAVTLLDDGDAGRGHEGRAYLLTGPQLVTYAEVAADLSTVTGRSIAFVDVPDDVARAGLLAAGAPEWFADGIVVLHGLLRRGIAAQTSDDVQLLTGREPRTFAEFARDYRDAFIG